MKEVYGVYGVPQVNTEEHEVQFLPAESKVCRVGFFLLLYLWKKQTLMVAAEQSRVMVLFRRSRNYSVTTVTKRTYRTYLLWAYLRTEEFKCRFQ